MTRTLAVFCVGMLLPSVLYCQEQQEIDRLTKIADGNPADTGTTRANCMLCYELRLSDSARARQYGEKGYLLAKQQNFLLGQASCLSNLALINRGKANYPLAISYYKQSYDARMQTHEKWRAAITLVDIGTTYMEAGDYPNAATWLMSARESFRNLKDTANEVYSLVTLGSVYYMNDDLQNAATIMEEALQLSIASKDSTIISTNYTNVGLLQGELGNYNIAFDYMGRAKKMDELRKDTINLAADYLNIGLMYFRIKDYSHALENYEVAAVLYRNMNNRPDLAITLNNIGEIWLEYGNYAKAIEYCNESYKIGEELKSMELQKEASKMLSRAYEASGDFTNAFHFQKIYSALKDSLFSSEKQAAISELQTKYNVENTEKQNEILAKELEMETMESEQRRMLNYGIGFIAVLVLSAAFVSFRAYRQKLKANSLLETKNALINEQKLIVEEKNKNITDSINYAQKIQKAILPDANHFRVLFPESFIFFRPKDIVSGDFYWIHDTKEYTFYVTADCTGHGVPGGFMSVLGASLLNEVVNEKKIYEPADILDMMRLKIIIALKQKGELGENKDGMDMILCRINKERTELVFAAANNPLWMIRNGLFTEYKPDKQAVGITIGESQQFTQRKIELQKGDLIYTLTDGYPDQFGGEKGKKYKYRQLQDKIASLSNLEMKYQHYAIEKEFDRWKGSIEQIDDVLLIGVKIT